MSERPHQQRPLTIDEIDRMQANGYFIYPPDDTDDFLPGARFIVIAAILFIIFAVFVAVYFWYLIS